MYKIKQLPEDFIVKEKLDLKLSENGTYNYYLLKKKGYSTFDAIELIAKKLRIMPKFINAAGLKDRQAVTEQTISISKGVKRNYDFTYKKGDENRYVKLEFLGRGDERINIGTLDGNYFDLVIRNLSQEDVSKIPAASSGKRMLVPNYFDTQRFGRDSDNHLIGRMLVKKRFKEAAEALAAKDAWGISEFLTKSPGNFIGALRSQPRRILKFYVVAYQSYLWNSCVRKYIETMGDPVHNDDTFPMLGFDTEEDNDKKKEIIDEVCKKESINARDLIIRQMPELTLESQDRAVFAEAEELLFSAPEDDELNSGMKKIKASFYLKKGSYATNVIKELFGGARPLL
ncbi:tRNA pseudouridine(13) synthase TruD [Candidatus Woesearchaeota archaeon]|nr:tRNA pseudouridine(13) synthase TruD [Candidatus Woesearchaeota archaeon]